MTIQSLVKSMLGVKQIHVDDVKLVEDADGVVHLKIYLRPHKSHSDRCPICGRRCSGYDAPNSNYTVWRDLDCNGVIVELYYRTHRIECKKHGVQTAAVPWAYHNSRFTKRFDLQVAWLSRKLSKSALAELMRIDWKTVGRCVSRALNVLEPDRARRLDGLVNIGIDETSYKKGHKYLTVIVNHDTNEVVWVHKDHGKSVLEEFFNSLTDEQKASIERVSGDGARWITDCVNEHIPHAVRCLDFFHLIGWCNETLDKLRTELWQAAKKKYEAKKKEVNRGKGRPKKDDIESKELSHLNDNKNAIKGSKTVLLVGNEKLSKKQEKKLKRLGYSNSSLMTAYSLKEDLRMIIQETNVEVAEALLKQWYYRASHCKSQEVKDLAKKVKRHTKHILNTIEHRLSNARIEATNNKIKLLIRMSYGFRNLQNLFDMVYLNCSKIDIPLPNRKGSIAKERELLNTYA